MSQKLARSTSWLKWLTPGLEIKRWTFLLMVSMVILVLGVSYALKDLYGTLKLPHIFYYITLQQWPYWARAIVFGVFGVGFFGYSFIMLQRSVLGPFLPGGDRSVADIIYSYRTLGRGPRIVAIGGGTGLSTLLRGLKDFTANISAIVTVADDGGSSGKLRDEYRILPPGDIRQCIVALADAEPLVKKLFDYRFREGSLNGHSFGNLFITAMRDVTGDFEQAVRESARVLAVRGTILPSTLHDVTLVASINGHHVEGESQIPKQQAPISRVFLKPDNPEMYPEAELHILNADLIVVGPGSLYTSILPNLLVPGMVAAIKASPATKVFVCNVAEQPGETAGYGVHDYLHTIEEHVGGNIFDYVLVNSNYSHAPTGGQSLVVFHPQDAARHRSVRFIAADVMNNRVPSHHDSEKLAKVIMKRIWQA